MVVRLPTTERREDRKEKTHQEVGSKDNVGREWRGAVRIEGGHLLAK